MITTGEGGDMGSRDDMRQRALQYLAGDDDLATFHDWFVAESWHTNAEDDPGLVRLVDAVDALFVRRSVQEITDHEFDASLREVVETPVTVEIRYSAVSWTVSTALRSASSDTRHLVASG
jgi:hypothetical protein